MVSIHLSGFIRDIFVELIQVIKNLSRTLRLIWSITSRLTLVNLISSVILGILPICSLYLTKLIVDTATTGILAPDKHQVFSLIIPLVIIAAIIAIFTAFFRSFSHYISIVQSSVLTDGLNNIIHEKSVHLELAYYENKEYQDTLHRAQFESNFRINRVLLSIVKIGQSLISIGSVLVILISFSPIAGLIIFSSTIPFFVIRILSSAKIYALKQLQTENERKGRYFHWIVTSQIFAKEIRLFDLGSFFIHKFNDIQVDLRHEQLSLHKKQLIWESFSQIFMTAAIFGSFLYIVIQTVEGGITPGDMVMYFMGFQMFIGYIQSIFGGMSDLYQDQLFLDNLFQFLDHVPEIIVPPSPKPVPQEGFNQIVFDRVSFSYPGTDENVLSEVSFQIRKGEIIALVGENGAGKSSIVKLLALLYHPDRGKILVDGIDIRSFDPIGWRKHIAILFQDYSSYQLTVEENIRLGDLNHPGRVVETAAKKADADTFISQLTKGYQSVLGNFFSGGHELSTGQWQRIALARTFYRDADLVILDEPSSSLDALAEMKIFEIFKELVIDKSAIIISHRFSTIMMADKIYVLDKGKIVEEGSHRELYEKNGKYTEMFRAQADSYQV
ncbi:ABC transporter ATP-binding protein [Methanospirillum stamsii]|uniref:ABC transporter ATP-binding protein n=1 Tax=Methanospirillum stamsii TaxID=1277351 RepID=UPI0015E860F7|nr:ABC transporter ATP-binding protein [Methanospirillum stamsii]